MPNKDKNIPKRRFKAFENADAWELRKLKELADFSKGLGYTKNDLTESGNPIILYGRLYTKYQTVIDNVDTFVDVKDKSVVSIGGEVIVPSSGESSEDIARASVVDNAGVILGGDLNVIKPKDEIDSAFLALTISNGQQQKELSKRAQGKSVVHLHNSDLKEVNLIFPSIDEQKQIGELFKGIENTITLHQRKLDKLKSVKQAYLSEMFPAEGERVPKRRFPGFTDDWELRKLRNIFHNIENAFVGIATPHYVSDGRFYLESNNIKDGQVNYETKVFISEEFYQRQKNKWLRAGDIVMVQSGHVGHSAVIPEELDCSAAHALIMFRKQKVKISSNFLNYQFQTKQSKIKLDLITTGNTIKHILSSEMKEFNANFPSHPEQETIGTFFSTLDRHITLHQRKSI